MNTSVYVKNIKGTEKLGNFSLRSAVIVVQKELSKNGKANVKFIYLFSIVLIF